MIPKNPGCLKDPLDLRDLRKSNDALGVATVDYNNPPAFPILQFWNQAESLTCVAGATSYYGETIDNLIYSKRDLYARIALPAGGAYLRGGILGRVNVGQSLESADPDPNPPTESAMRVPGTGPRQPGHDANGWAIIDYTIDGIAAAILNYKGALFGVTGSDEGWADLSNPRPPLPGEATWGHALFAGSYHMHDGVKCIMCASTWEAYGTTNQPLIHHIKEDYFDSGNTFNPWTLIPKGNYMPDNVKIVNYKGTVGIFIEAHSIAELIALGAAFNKPVDVDSTGNVTNPDIVV